MVCFNFFGSLDDLAHVEHVADATVRFSLENLMEIAMFTASSLAFSQFLM